MALIPRSFLLGLMNSMGALSTNAVSVAKELVTLSF